MFVIWYLSFSTFNNVISLNVGIKTNCLQPKACSARIAALPLLAERETGLLIIKNSPAEWRTGVEAARCSDNNGLHELVKYIKS